MYYLLYAIYILCYPLLAVCSLIWPNANYHFASWLVFPNKWKRSLAFSVSYVETANFTSNVYNSYSNAFGMGVTANSPYQKSGYKGLSTEPTLAVYSSVFSSLYDFKDYIYRRAGGTVKASFDNTPSKWFGDGIVSDSYTYQFIYALKTARYFASGFQGYYIGAINGGTHFKAYTLCSIVVLILSPLGLLYMLRRRLPRRVRSVLHFG